jgi:hypothetical protein
MTDFIHLHRCVETPWNNPRSFGDAVPARAATPSGPSLLRVSGIAGIAIAAVCVLYFAGQLLRAVRS